MIIINIFIPLLDNKNVEEKIKEYLNIKVHEFKSIIKRKNIKDSYFENDIIIINEDILVIIYYFFNNVCYKEIKKFHN